MQPQPATTRRRVSRTRRLRVIGAVVAIAALIGASLVKLAIDRNDPVRKAGGAALMCPASDTRKELLATDGPRQTWVVIGCQLKVEVYCYDESCSASDEVNPRPGPTFAR